MGYKSDQQDYYWQEYLTWWSENVKDESTPPTDADFWVWFVKEKLPQQTGTAPGEDESGNQRKNFDFQI